MSKLEFRFNPSDKKIALAILIDGEYVITWPSSLTRAIRGRFLIELSKWLEGERHFTIIAEKEDDDVGDKG